MPDLEDIFEAGRKISGKAYRGYQRTAKRRKGKQKISKAEKARTQHIRSIRREVMGRVGPMAAIPFLTIAPFVTNLMGGQIVNVMVCAGAFFAFSYGLYEVRRGLVVEADELMAEAESEAPPITVSGPHKLSGIALIALGMAGLAVVAGFGIQALGFAALTAGAGVWSLGTRGLMGRSERQVPSTPLERDVADSPLGAALIAAQKPLHQLYDSAILIKNSGLRDQALGVHEAAAAVIDELHEDPSDLPKARRFLVTYLDGAATLVASYAEQSRRGTSSALDTKLSDTLVTFEQTFAAQLKKLRSDDEMDLDIQMDVLEIQMKNEGVL